MVSKDPFIFGGFKEDKIDSHAVKPRFLPDDRGAEKVDKF